MSLPHGFITGVNKVLLICFYYSCYYHRQRGDRFPGMSRSGSNQCRRAAKVDCPSTYQWLIVMQHSSILITFAVNKRAALSVHYFSNEGTCMAEKFKTPLNWVVFYDLSLHCRKSEQSEWQIGWKVQLMHKLIGQWSMQGDTAYGGHFLRYNALNEKICAAG